MNRNSRSYLIVALTNIIIVCLAQIFYQTLLEESINIAIFEFLIFPLLFVLINFFLWFSQFKLEFNEHALFAYLAFFVYVIVSSIWKLVIIGPAQELPPGEIVLGADLILILAISIIQCLILLFLNFICYIGYRIFGTRKT